MVTLVMVVFPVFVTRKGMLITWPETKKGGKDGSVIVNEGVCVAFAVMETFADTVFVLCTFPKSERALNVMVLVNPPLSTSVWVVLKSTLKLKLFPTSRRVCDNVVLATTLRAPTTEKLFRVALPVLVTTTGTDTLPVPTEEKAEGLVATMVNDGAEVSVMVSTNGVVAVKVMSSAVTIEAEKLTTKLAWPRKSAVVVV